MNNVAVKEKVAGIGGWLILPIIGLFLTPILTGMNLVNGILPAFQPEAWATLTTAGGTGYHPVWAPYLIFGLISACILIIAAIVLLVLLFKKLSIFPKLIIAYYIFIFAAALIDIVVLYFFILKAFPLLEATIQADVIKQMARALVAILIWVPYFIKSERVKNTFVN